MNRYSGEIDDEADALPYDQLATESAKAYAAFLIYRNLGSGRTVAETSRRYHSKKEGENRAQTGRRRGRSSGQIREWATKFRWEERARAWDQHQDEVYRKENHDALKEMAKRHVNEAKAIQFKAIERMAKMTPEELAPRDVLSFLIEGAKMERLAMGAPDTIDERRVVGKDGEPISKVVLYIPDNGRNPELTPRDLPIGLPEQPQMPDEAEEG